MKKLFKKLTLDEVQDISSQEGWDVEYQQLEKGPFTVKFREISSSRFLFSSESFSGKIHISGASPTDFVSFGVSTTNSIYNGRLLKPSQIVYLPNDKQIDFVGRKDGEVRIIYVPLEDFKRRIQYVDNDALPHMLQNTRILSNNLESDIFILLKKIKYLPSPGDKAAHHLRNSLELMFDQALDLIIDGLLDNFSNFSNNLTHKLHKNHKLAKHLLEFMLNNLTTSLSITDMCEVSGLSRRNLFYSFKNYYGTSPYNYFLLLRLRAIRNDLLKKRRPEVKIGDLIYKYNFYNFSDFSNIYKNTFGESPSQTLSK